MNTIEITKPELTIIYIHGLGKTCETSNKFNVLKEHFKANKVIGFNWSQSDDLEKKIREFIKKNVDVDGNVLIVGSSAGGKVALLMKDILSKRFDTFAMVVLLNPLMDVKNRTDKNTNILTNDYLIDGNLHSNLTEAVLIYSETDDIIDQVKNANSIPKYNRFVNVGVDTHNLKNSTNIIIEEIQKYLNAYV